MRLCNHGVERSALMLAASLVAGLIVWTVFRQSSLVEPAASTKAAFACPQELSPPLGYDASKAAKSAPYWSWPNVVMPTSLRDENRRRRDECYDIMKHVPHVQWMEAALLEHSHYGWLQHAHDLALDNLFAVNLTSARRLFEKKPGETLQGFVFGGSFTAGLSCRSPDENKFPCPFSRRLEAMLKQLMPTVSVVIRNFGKGGTNSKIGLVGLTNALLYHTPREDEKDKRAAIDFVVLDYSVNDFRGELKETHDVGAIYEAAVRTVHAHAPSAVIFILISEFMAKDPSIVLEMMSSEILRTGLRSGSLVVDYRSMCQQTNYCPWHARGCENGVMVTHPDYVVHNAVAEMLADAFVRLFLVSCRGVSFSDIGRLERHLNASTYTKCMQPTTFVSAKDPPSPWVTQQQQPNNSLRANSSEWVLVQSRPTKMTNENAGWIGSVPGSKIAFNITFGEQTPKMMSVTYLKSSSMKMCRARLLLNGRGIELDASSPSSSSSLETVQRTSPRSFVWSEWFVASRDVHEGYYGYHVEPNSSLAVSLEVLPGRPG